MKKIKFNTQASDKDKSDILSRKNPNFIYRVVFGLAMLCLYLFLTSYSTICVIGISLSVVLGIMYELIAITKKSDKPYPINRFFVFSIASILFLDKAIPALALFYPQVNVFIKFSHIKPFIFTLYALCFISIVTQLERKSLRSQLLLLLVIHVSAYIAGLTFATSIKNINYGRFFFVYPCLLVISNDIFAYFVGKIFGKTPLISLSPNKTLEGFFGGFIFTFLIGNLIGYLKVNNLFFNEPGHTHLELPVSIDIPLFNIPSMYIHNFAFVFAASFLAPFCGFIASAIKRSFQKKDFGSIIPGHGGITDRFDCQILMVFFTHYYMRVFFNENKSSAALIYKFLVDNLTDDDLKELSKILTRAE